ASAVRARVPVRAGYCFAVVILRDFLGGGGGEVHRAPGVVDRFLRVTEYEGCAWFLASVVTRVRLRESETKPQSVVALSNAAGVVQRLTSMTAVADHIETPIPFGGKAHFECDLGCDQTCDAAMDRRDASRWHRRSGDLHDFLGLELAQGIASLARLDIRFPIVYKCGLQLGEILGAGRSRANGAQDHACKRCARHRRSATDCQLDENNMLHYHSLSELGAGRVYRKLEAVTQAFAHSGKCRCRLP